jgi:hypothetical protein
VPLRNGRCICQREGLEFDSSSNSSSNQQEVAVVVVTAAATAAAVAKPVIKVFIFTAG